MIDKDDLAGRLEALQGIAPKSDDDWTYLNDAARDLIKLAATALRAAPPATDTGMQEALEEAFQLLENIGGSWDGSIEVRAKIRAALSRPLQVADTREGRQFLHVKTGSRYTEITRGMLQGESSVVIYRSDAEGSLWIRPESEFDDGRFVEISSASVPVLLSVVEKCARVAEMFSINKTAIHPDVDWDAMSQQAQHVAHMTCQNVAEAIRALASGVSEKTGE